MSVRKTEAIHPADFKKGQSFWWEEFQLYSCAKKFWHVNGLFYEELEDVMAFV